MPLRDLALKSDGLFYIGDERGDPSLQRAAGLYARDVRHLRPITCSLNDQPIELFATTMHHATAATITSANPAIPFPDRDPLLPHQVSIEQRLSLDSCLHLGIVVESFALEPLDLWLTLTLIADFADIFEIRGFERTLRGTLMRPQAFDHSIRFGYRGLDNTQLGTIVSFDRAPTIEALEERDHEEDILVSLIPGHDVVHWEPGPFHAAGVNATFPMHLERGTRWELRVTVEPDVGEPACSPVIPVVVGQPPIDRATIHTDNADLDRVLHNCLEDLQALTTSFPEGPLPAAGVPWYVAPFGRDSLIVGLQTLHIAPREVDATLRVLAAMQGEKVDPWTEEEPGKILHEKRYGEMARTREIPHIPYYGTVDATPLFILLFSECVSWTGDEELFADLLPHVDRALDWIDHYGDRDGDGLIEYSTEQATGSHIRHEVWKDSHDSLNYADGTPATGDIAAVEVQGYLYAAYMRLADVLDAFSVDGRAAHLRERARTLAEQVDRLFWVDELEFFAQALDGDKRPVDAVSSNPGQLLFTGILSPERAAAVAGRLRRPDMDSGWGIRTLSSAAARYNPMSYHNGSVWPHDNALIAEGCYRIGDTATGDHIFTSLFDAAVRSPNFRLAELYCGFGRRGLAVDRPIPYPGACSPQAWAASAFPHLIRSALRLTIDLPNGRVRVDPHLPPFIDEVTVRHLSVLGTSGDLWVRRSGDGYRVESDSLPLA